MAKLDVNDRQRRPRNRPIAQEISHALSLEPRPDYGQFNLFSVDQWTQWIDSFLDGQPTEPLVPVARAELHHALLSLSEELESGVAQRRFAEAIARLFETTPVLPQNTERLFYLIQLISRLKPIHAKTMTRRLLYGRSLEGMSYGHRDLQLMLLVTSSEYDFDDEFSYFIERSAEREEDYTKLLVYFRTLAKNHPKEAWSLYEARILPQMESGSKADQTVRILREILRRTGYRSLLEWLVARLQACTASFPVQMNTLAVLLTDRVLPADYSGPDGHLHLVAALVRRSEQLLDPTTLVRLAGLKPRLGSLVSETLRLLWQMRIRTRPEQPWYIIYPGEGILRAGQVEDKVVIVNVEGVALLDPANPIDREIVETLQQTPVDDFDEVVGSSTRLPSVHSDSCPAM